MYTSEDIIINVGRIIKCVQYGLSFETNFPRVRLNVIKDCFWEIEHCEGEKEGEKEGKKDAWLPCRYLFDGYIIGIFIFM